jgi:hypothetical protein
VNCPLSCALAAARQGRRRQGWFKRPWRETRSRIGHARTWGSEGSRANAG